MRHTTKWDIAVTTEAAQKANYSEKWSRFSHAVKYWKVVAPAFVTHADAEKAMTLKRDTTLVADSNEMHRAWKPGDGKLRCAKDLWREYVLDLL